MKTHEHSLWIFGVFSLIFGQNSWAVPFEVSSAAGDFEFDVLNAELIDDMIFDTWRNAVIDEAKIWPNAVVLYKIVGDFGKQQVAAIKSAMASIEAVSCIRFYKAGKNVRSYVRIVYGSSDCRSSVGYKKGLQILQLSKRCFNRGTIIHELMHTLGFYHQHMAPDRDNYISVNWENIMKGKRDYFWKLKLKTSTDFGYGYDYKSVMHYPRKYFSANGLDTITPLDSEAVIGQRVDLSPKDIRKLNAMYKCRRVAATEGSRNTCVRA